MKVRFILVGAGSFFLYLALIALARSFSPAPYWLGLSGGVAATVSGLIAYLGHRRLTFRSRTAHRTALPRFLLVNVIAAGTGAVINFLLAGLPGGGVWIGGQILYRALWAFAAYTLQRRFVFQA